MTRRWAPAAALVLALSCASRGPPSGDPPEDEIWASSEPEVPGRQRIAVAREEEVPGALDLTARVAFDDQRVAHVFPPLSGRVTRVLAAPGDRVRKGAPLAAMLSPDAGAAFSDLAKAEADLAQARAERERQRRLRAVDASSPRDLEAAEDAFARADAEAQRARQRAALLRRERGSDAVGQEILLRSPIAGVVLARGASPGLEVGGLYAGASPPELFTVGALDRVWALADVPEADLPKVRIGARAGLRVLAFPGRVFQGTVGWIADALDPVLRTARLRVALANPDGSLKPDMYGQLTLDLPPHRALVVPRQALVRVEGQDFAYVAMGPAPGGRTRFQRRHVRVAGEAGDLAVVADGIAAGDRIVYEGPPTHDVEVAPVRITPEQARRIGLQSERVDALAVSQGIVAGARLAFDDQRVAHVFSPVNGRVARVLAAPGEHVRKGAPLLAISSPDVGSAFADAARARADLTAATHELERQRELFAAHAGSAHDLEAAQNAEGRARAELERAEQKTRLLSAGSFDAVTQEYTLRSPVDGEVVGRAASVGLEVQGQWSGAANPVELFTVGSLDRLWVLGEIYEMDLPHVRKGQEARVQVPAFPGRSFAGRVEWVSESVDPTTRTARVRCTVDNSERLLRPEMAPTLAISGVEHQGLAVRRRALLRVGEGVVVFVAEPPSADGMLGFRPRRVVPLPASGDVVPVADGLVPGESVVTAGAVFLLGFL